MKSTERVKSWRIRNLEHARRYNREYMARYRRDHPDRVQASRRRIEDPRLAFFNALKDHPCVDCGGLFPPYVMDFDHVRGSKVVDLSKLRRASIEQIANEAAKCDLVCANCHRVRTFTRQQKYLQPAA